MRIDVAFTPHGLSANEFQGRTVFVIDVLRATTTICTALYHGAKGVIPATSIEDALRLSQTLEHQDVLLTGERHAARIEGFALGNSPLEMTHDAVAGKTLVMSTTNGTLAFLATQGAKRVYVAAGVNLEQAGQIAKQVLNESGELLVLCAGRESAFALEDAYTAGRLAFEAVGGRWIRKGLNDAAVVCLDLVRRYGARWDRVFARSRAGQDLRAKGFGGDVDAAAQESSLHIVPQYHKRLITAGAMHGGDPPS